MMYCRSCHCQRRDKCDKIDCYIGSFSHLTQLRWHMKIDYASPSVLISVWKYGLKPVNGRKRRARIDENGTVVILS